MNRPAGDADRLVALFASEATAVDATVEIFDDVQGLRDGLALLCDQAGGRVMATAAVSGLLPSAPRLADSSAAALAEVSMGVSLAWRGVAETGSCVLLPASRSERLLAVCAPWHVVVLPVPRIVATLDLLMEDVAGAVATADGQAPYVTMITGPSRTADIERIITIGAHGPRRLQVNLVRGWGDA
ncbi:MAG TPA: LUD domain-containing protein [Candidatus Dormibacteraeota bacterium]|nr:LUD domain-containing protein [Candidatus Dormibacteraeota bacterium]